MNLPHTAAAQQRLAQIEQARHAVMREGRAVTEVALDGWADRAWIERSWRRCLANGQRPDQRVAFDVLPAQARRRAQEASHGLVSAARPVLDKLGRAIANTRYFAILTDARGVVVDVNGPIDRSDRRAQLITRIGVDLSERSVGTTAIGAVLAELQPVWLHRGEHFFHDTSMYSCAGAPLFGPDGQCVGMLDLTGIDTAERPELKHLVAQSARSIENALALSQPHSLLLRLNWPGRTLGDDADGDGASGCGVDCDDGNKDVYPGAAEVCGDGNAQPGPVATASRAGVADLRARGDGGRRPAGGGDGRSGGHPEHGDPDQQRSDQQQRETGILHGNNAGERSAGSPQYN